MTGMQKTVEHFLESTDCWKPHKLGGRSYGCHWFSDRKITELFKGIETTVSTTKVAEISRKSLDVGIAVDWLAQRRMFKSREADQRRER
ncbi:hypothetical protein B9Z55_023465 [Caenorhabditis nigoni]|nr:hypothetical protein B9Z55_023462 [Caenorhabditis nigoni]PIC17108.1 hypothetical protein B9Z55_023465 [Caenorhabditis nigoni]